MVRKLYELPYKIEVPLSAPFVSFRVHRPALRGILAHVIKHVVISMDGPHPSEPAAKQPLLYSLPFAWSSDVMNHIVFLYKIVLMRKRLGRGAQLLMSLLDSEQNA